MPTTTMDVKTGGFLISQATGTRSLDSVQVYAGASLTSIPAGTILSLMTAGANLGKYGVYDNASADGRTIASGVSMSMIDASTADQLVTIVARDAEINYERLSMGSLNAAAKTDAESDLLLKGIVFRKGS